MVSYLYRMPAGIPGEWSRMAGALIEPQVVTAAGQTGAPTAYGVALVIDATSHKVRTLASGDRTAAFVWGVLVRPFPTGGSQDPLGTSTPPASGVVDVGRRGFGTVLLSGGGTPPVNGGQVYLWTSAATGLHITGGWEATDPSTDGFAVPDCFFKGPPDANNNVEIEFRI